MSDQAEMVRFADKVQRTQQKMAPDQVNLAPERKAGQQLAEVEPRSRVMDEQFPTDALTMKEKKDKVMEAKLQLQGDQVGYTPFGKLEARDEDFEWYQRKQAAVETANFQKWFAENFDLMSPADKKRAKELYPEFYRQRKKLLKQQTKNLMRLAKLKLEGVESMEDLHIQYLAETGRLDIGPLKHLLNPEAAPGMTEAMQQAKFKRGLLSPFRVFGEEALVQRGESGLGERAIQASDFASRVFDERDLTLGAKTGFPPMDTRYPNQQMDKQWFELLRTGQ